MAAPESSVGQPPKDLFQAPPEMVMVFNRVLMRHFPHMDRGRMVVLARDKALDLGDDQSTIAACGVNPDPDAEFECIFWFALEAWQLLDERGREALVFHELTHCGHDEQGRPVLVPHDAGVFTAEVEQYGTWWKDAQARFKARSDAASKSVSHHSG